MNKARVKTWELILPILNGISKTIAIDSIVDQGGGKYVINTCDTKWLTLTYIVTIGANDYKIVDLMPNEWILVSGPSLPVAESFEAYNFFKYHGTVLLQLSELVSIKNSKEKVPFAYLHEITREKFNEDTGLLLGRESDCDFYFMVDCNQKDWITNDHDRYAVQPMRNLMFDFIDALKSSSSVMGHEIFDYEVFDHANWGIYFDKGHTKKIFPDNLSGCQLKITIPFLKQLCIC